MSSRTLQGLIGTALTDPEFCDRLLNGERHTLLVEFGLTDDEQSAIMAIEAGSLQEFAACLDEWLQEPGQVGARPAFSRALRELARIKKDGW